MAICFVIQPFDGGKYDKRYEDVYAPAIKEAGLDPYRVDKDPQADVPIEAIEKGIRSAAACLADITTDNPNVWYELGFAFALGRPIIMVCSEERTENKYPFDIQHRTVIAYKSESISDFASLRKSILDRLRAALKRVDVLKEIESKDQVAPLHGLSQLELVVLATVAGNMSLPNEEFSVHLARVEVERAGFTQLGFALGLKRLQAKKFVTLQEAADFNGEAYRTHRLIISVVTRA